jgi:hypothetical protein
LFILKKRITISILHIGVLRIKEKRKSELTTISENTKGKNENQ